jgi:cytochrome c-type biogenesis protein CcmE
VRVGVLRWAVLAAVVAACVGYLVYSATGSSAEYYVTVAELKRHPPAGEARVLGTVQDDVRRSDGGLHVAFTAEDAGSTLPVEYTGTLPDIFRPGAQVVVEGRLGPDGVFHASTLLAKCPSRFSSGTPAG